MFVIAKSAPVVFVVGIDTLSLAVAGERVVPVLDQKPTAPEPEIVPLQVKSPVVLLTVQPVAAEPPAMLTFIAPSAWRLRAVEVAPNVPAPAKVMAVAEVAIVSIEVTPVKAPPVVTSRPAESIEKFPPPEKAKAPEVWV